MRKRPDEVEKGESIIMRPLSHRGKSTQAILLESIIAMHHQFPEAF